MKGFSLYEPWATLTALNEKHYETRSWKTNYRGPLLICSSKRKLPLWQYPPIKKVLDALFRHGLFLDDLKFGYALCIVDLVDIFRTEEILSFVPWEDETYFGDFSRGRFAWSLENPQRFKNPPPIKGRQGLFDVDDFYKSLDTYGAI